MEKQKKRNLAKKYIVHFRLNENELHYIKTKAKEAGITPSEYMRKATLNVSIESKIDLDISKLLLKECANLNRLGGLFKWWFTQPKPLTCEHLASLNDKITIMKVINKIYEVQDNLYDKIDKILKKRNPS